MVPVTYSLVMSMTPRTAMMSCARMMPYSVAPPGLFAKSLFAFGPPLLRTPATTAAKTVPITIMTKPAEPRAV